MEESLQEVKRAWGPEAVILQVEEDGGVLAALDPEARAERVPEALAPLYRELRELKGMLRHLTPWRSEAALEAYARLLACGVPEATAREALEELGERAELMRAVELLLRRLRTGGPVRAGRPLALVGPSGVGKSSTCVKLAVQLLRRGEAVRAVNLDPWGYNEGARSLRRVLPLQEATDAEELRRAVVPGQTVLIDTPGVAPQRRDGVEELASCLRAVGAEVHLVLSATTKEEDLEEALRAFEPLGYRSLIFTKLDETSSLGVLLWGGLRKPVSYLTNGRAAEDIEVATADRLLELALGGWRWDCGPLR